MKGAESLYIGMPPRPFWPRYNIHPGESVLAITAAMPGLIVPLEWGVRDGESVPINTPIETLPAHGSSPQRCAVLADGFYLWPSPKIAYWIHRSNAELFLLGGIVIENRISIVTTKATRALRTIHERVPVTFHVNDLYAWLSGENEPHSPIHFDARHVSRRVGNPRCDDPGCIAPLLG